MKAIVWYKNNREDAIEFIYEVIDNYKKINIQIKDLKNSKNDFIVRFDNKDEWRIVKLKESARGHKCNLSYYPLTEFITQDEFYLIRSVTRAFPYSAAVGYCSPSISFIEETKEEEKIELPFD